MASDRRTRAASPSPICGAISPPRGRVANCVLPRGHEPANVHRARDGVEWQADDVRAAALVIVKHMRERGSTDTDFLRVDGATTLHCILVEVDAQGRVIVGGGAR